MTRKYSCTRSKTRRNKLRNTRRHRGGRGGLGVGSYGSASTTAATSALAQMAPAPFGGGKRGMPIAPRSTTRKNRKH